MTLDIRERYDDHQENLRVVCDALQSRMWTMLPGIIVSYDITGNSPVAAVKLAIKGYDTANDGTRTFHDLPTLPHCPVVFPRGGGYSMTFPVKEGDECIVLFSSRSIDEWWQSGVGQPAFDFRQHDLSDGVCFVGLTSKAAPIGVLSATTAQFQADDGSVSVALDKSTKTVNITGPGGITCDGPLHVTGAITADSTVTASGNVTGNSIRLDSHTHSGVQTGSGNTGGPQ